MLTNTGPVHKLYLSIIDDVVESMRDLFLQEELEDGVLDELRCLWESKVAQSKAIEGFRQDNASPKFALQLPASYSQAAQKPTVVIPAGQHLHHFSAKEMQSNAGAIAAFSLPARVTYPVQIPAGATLQTASGQFYKVNVPVMVTQALAGPAPFSHPTQPGVERKEPAAPQPATAPPAGNTLPPQKMEQISVLVTPAPQPPDPRASLSADVAPQVVNVNTAPAVSNQSADLQVKEEETLTCGPEVRANKVDELQVKVEEARTHGSESRVDNVEELLRQAIKEEERAKAVTSGPLVPSQGDNQAEDYLKLVLDYGYRDLTDIIQLDGPADNSEEEEEGLPLLENEFLVLINAEALSALEKEGDSSSSSSDSEMVDEANDEEEDPLNSGDDVIEQDIPDLFDTDNVIVCQYDKIHRSKNRWKFYLKDGVMSYRGKDYVFSKAVGEAEW